MFAAFIPILAKSGLAQPEVAATAAVMQLQALENFPRHKLRATRARRVPTQAEGASLGAVLNLKLIQIKKQRRRYGILYLCEDYIFWFPISSRAKKW
jgi:hypothetical protein